MKRGHAADEVREMAERRRARVLATIRSSRGRIFCYGGVEPWGKSGGGLRERVREGSGGCGSGREGHVATFRWRDQHRCWQTVPTQFTKKKKREEREEDSAGIRFG